MANQKYLMWSGRYVGNSLLFWREGKTGYTTDIDKAHRFNSDEALRIQKGSHGEAKMIPLSHCEKISTRQVHADHIDRDLIGKDVTNG